MAFASFYAGEFPGVWGGVFVVFAICVAFAIVIDLLAKFIAPAFFKPDITATADPLAPDPKILTTGINKAFELAASRKRSVRLLISRIPGYDIELRLNASRLFIEVVIEKGRTDLLTCPLKPLVHKTQITKLVPRRSPTIFNLPGDGGANILIIVHPDATWHAPFPCEPRPTLGYKIPLFSTIVILTNLWRVALI